MTNLPSVCTYSAVTFTDFDGRLHDKCELLDLWSDLTELMTHVLQCGRTTVWANNYQHIRRNDQRHATPQDHELHAVVLLRFS